MLTFESQHLVPQGGFEPPQSEPESEVLPLHNRGMQCSINLQIFKKNVNSKSLKKQYFSIKKMAGNLKELTVTGRSIL